MKNVDWRDKVVEFLRERIDHRCRLKVLRKACEIIEKLLEASMGTVTGYVREDRGSN